MKNEKALDKYLIYLITEGISTPENFEFEKARILKIIKLAVEANIDLIQIREKQISARLISELTSEAVKIALNSLTKIIVNDRADIAVAANADGVHLTANSISTEAIRRCFPKPFIIGVSAHSVSEVKNAKNEGASFATFSPIFATESKANYGAPQGLEKLSEVCSKIDEFPIVALGGVNKNNFAKALEHGASGFAAIRFLNSEETLKKIAKDRRGSRV